jgi:hypothetical protein
MGFQDLFSRSNGYVFESTKAVFVLDGCRVTHALLDGAESF